MVSRATHEVRIIGGQWKRSKLQVLDKPGLRPTPDRVRETLFNWLGQDLRGWRCIDVFAGTGALGFEAASRGALHVTMVEQDRALRAALEAMRTRLQAEAVQVTHGDGVTVLRRLAVQSMDLVFLDPPFESALLETALRAAAPVLRPGGWLYLEAGQAWTDENLAGYGLALQRHLKAGAVHAHLLQRPVLPNA